MQFCEYIYDFRSSITAYYDCDTAAGHMKNPKLETDLKGMDHRSDRIAS